MVRVGAGWVRLNSAEELRGSERQGSRFVVPRRGSALASGVGLVLIKPRMAMGFAFPAGENRLKLFQS